VELLIKRFVTENYKIDNFTITSSSEHNESQIRFVNTFQNIFSEKAGIDT
jgi:ribosomal protein S18